MPRRIYTYQSGMGWDFWNLISTLGAFLIAASTLIFLHNFFRSRKKGEIAGNDPWDARTLEWSIASPPPIYNFVEIPVVESRDPYWEQKYPHGLPVPSGGAADSGESHSLAESDRLGPDRDVFSMEEAHHLGIHMPSLSHLPIMTGFGLAMAGLGIVYHPIIAAVGLVITIIGIYSWALEPATEPSESSGE